MSSIVAVKTPAYKASSALAASKPPVTTVTSTTNALLDVAHLPNVQTPKTASNSARLMTTGSIAIAAARTSAPMMLYV